MQKVKSFIRENYIYSSPFLFALYSVLFLFAKNQKEYRPEVLVTPLTIAVVFTLIVFVLARLVVRRTDVSALIASLIVFVSLSYGRFLLLSKDLSFTIGSYRATSEVITGVVTGFIVLVFFFLIFMFRRNLKVATKFIFFLSVILVALPLFNSISFELRSKRLWAAPVSPDKVFFRKNRDEVKDIESYPDIYYFIFDRYAGQKALKEEYGFDNSTFLNFLKDKGFYIAENSTANYPKTFLSLGSSLNMRYLDDLTEKTNGGSSADESFVTPLIRNSEVIHYLKDQGYSYIHIGSWWEPTKKNPNATRQFAPRFKEYWGADEFTTGFYNTTIASPILKAYFKEPSDVSKDPANNSHRQSALQQFAELKKVPNMGTPKFVFAHILLPHDPYVFDKDCNPISETVVNKNTHQVNYVNQVQCVNIKIEEMIEDILKNSKKPPVIILQSDEGPFPMNAPIGGDQGWGKAKEESLHEKFPILNAYYLPGVKNAGLYQTITPVNSFRVVFNAYFNSKLPLLEDKDYIFQDGNNYYKFIDVTSKVKN